MEGRNASARGGPYPVDSPGEAMDKVAVAIHNSVQTDWLCTELILVDYKGYNRTRLQAACARGL